MVRLTKLLFVIQTRTSTGRKTDRPLTDQERIEGWFDGAEHDWTTYKDRQSNEGHERGRLHSMPPGSILTWNPEPGDRVLCTLSVEFEARVAATPSVVPDAEPHQWLDLVSARLDREVRGPPPDGHTRWVFCDSVLGRSVMLGEDGAEDAFGEDELRRTLEAALADDWRPVQCAYRLEDLPADLRAAQEQDFHAAWPRREEFADLKVARPPTTAEG